jgi:hypothetical protein
MANKSLNKAKETKNDEFYTQFIDIQKEIEAYLEYNPNVFNGKVVYCNCDDPYESNFFRYFVLNFNKLGLKQLITTSYKPSPIANTQLALFGNDKAPTKMKGRSKITANKFIINKVHDINGDGEFNLKDVSQQLKENKHNEWSPLNGDGDFRSDESVELLKLSDIVITNPPFSLFREYVKQLFDYKKKFLIIGNMHAITYIEVFPLIKNNKLWLGNKTSSQQMFFEAQKEYTKKVIANKPQGMWWRIIDGKPLIGIHTALWFTNLDHGRRHQPLQLMTEAEIIKFVTKKPFEKYDNYDAIEVSFVKNIPDDYKSVMGVPVSFLDNYNPDQFEILGSNRGVDQDPNKVYGRGSYLNGKEVYKRLFIKHKKK